MKTATLPHISILVAARNEAPRIGRCLDALAQLNYPTDKLQILVGDDASEDETATVVADYTRLYPHIQLIRIQTRIAQQRGKSNVLAQLAQVASGEYLFFTDADIAVPSQWLLEMLAYFNEKTAIVSGCTTIVGHNWLARFQAIEWLNAQASITWLARRKLPVTGVGNNMAVRTDAYRSIGGYESLPFSITEDYQLFRELLRNGWDFDNVYHPAVLAESEAMQTLQDLMRQRKRWLQGALQAQWYLQALFYGQALFLPCLLLLTWGLGPTVALLGWLGKIGIESIIMGRALRQIRRQSLLKWLPLFGIYYVFLNFAMLINYYLPTPTQWKGRQYSNL